MAHSLGTSVMYDYLTNGAMAAQRRANVGHYINVDGQSRTPASRRSRCGPEGHARPQHGRRAERDDPEPDPRADLHLGGVLRRVLQVPDRAPPAHDIVRRAGAIEVAGKALNFPENSGAIGRDVEIWPVDRQRAGGRPRPARVDPDHRRLDGRRRLGPGHGPGRPRYEFALVRPALPTLHIYYEPFVRSDYTLRLLESEAIADAVGYRPGSMSAVNIRYKELWGDQGAESDELLINGVNICTAALCPASKQVNALFAYDRNRDGQTDLSSPDPVLGQLPFIQGADVFIPASAPPDGTTSFQLLSRGTGPLRTLDIPNWDSLGDGVTIQWNDFER